MNQQLEKALFDMYEDEINIDSFNAYKTLLKTLILYKNLAQIESYFYKNKLNIFVVEDGGSAHEDAENTIIIGGKPYMPEEKNDKLISAFINRNIQEEQDKYGIYLDSENRVIHITKMDHSYGYSVFNSTIEKVFCAILTKIMPWYFENMPSEITQEYAPLFVDNANFHLFNEKFEQHIEESGIKDEIYMQQMAKLAVKITEKKKRAVQDEVRNDQSRIDDLFRQIHTINERLKGNRATLLAIEIQGEDYESPVNELVEFIRSTSENIVIEEVLDESIKFKFVTPLEYYDDYESCVSKNSGGSYLFGRRFEDFEDYSKEQIKAFYKKIVEEKALKVHVAGYITMNIVNGEVRGSSCDAITNAMPHHHLAEYSCFGNARETVSQYTLSNRYAEAVNQILYSAKQSTMGDTAAGEHFMSNIVRRECIECPDGKFRKFKDTMEYLIAEGMIDAE